MNTTTTPASPETSRPKVSVCVVTYNQEKYIAQCLQSLVDQETDFQFEVIVSDDCSTDGTSDIIQSFSTNYPNIIKHILHKENIGAYKNYKFIHAYAKDRCDYIAHVDGDDYALPGKLAAQVATLDLHPEISLSTHAVEIVDKTRLVYASDDLPEWGDMSTLLRLGTYFTNSSTMYRSSNAFDHSKEINMIDYYFHIEQASRGGIHFNKKCLGAHRWNPDGISKNKAHRNIIESAYDHAFVRAIELGGSSIEVNTGRLVRHKSFAINRLITDDRRGFIRLIHLSGRDWIYASWSHRFLSLFKFFFATNYGIAMIKRRVM